jgi:hypothetical protein
MGFFKRRNEQQEEEFVQTDAGWQPLQEAINKNWIGLAATAWGGYQQLGRGVVVVSDFASYEFGFSPAGSVSDDPEWPELRAEVLRLCHQYTPEREVVFTTEVTRGHGRDSRQSQLVTVLQTPQGGTSPPEALAQIQAFEQRQARR